MYSLSSLKTNHEHAAEDPASFLGDMHRFLPQVTAPGYSPSQILALSMGTRTKKSFGVPFSSGLHPPGAVC